MLDTATAHAIVILLALRDSFTGEGRTILARAIAHQTR